MASNEIAEITNPDEQRLIDRLSRIVWKIAPETQRRQQLRQAMNEPEAGKRAFQEITALWPLCKDGTAYLWRDRVVPQLIKVMPQLRVAPKPLKPSQELNTFGLTRLERLLDSRQLADVVDYFGQGFPLGTEASLLHFGTADVVRAPHVMEIATRPALLDVVGNFLGCAPTILEVSAWRSLPNGERAGAQMLHRDRDDFRACKLFLYLSDVGPEDGPHVFIRTSHDRDSVCRKFTNDPPDRVAAACFSKGGRELANLEQVFADEVCEITGPAGTGFLEVTYGWHRGKIPTRNERLLFQVLYGFTPFVERIERLQAAAFDRFPDFLPDTPQVRHALRYLLRPPPTEA